MISVSTCKERTNPNVMLEFSTGYKGFFFFSLREYFLCSSLAIRTFVTLDISKVLCYTFQTGQSHVTRHGKPKQDEASKQCVVLLTSNISHEYSLVFTSSEITYRDQINKPINRKKKLQVILPYDVISCSYRS